ncbi:MAG: hypothetical protein AAGJ37_15095, partial [Pseudomonadota bacterium]
MRFLLFSLLLVPSFLLQAKTLPLEHFTKRGDYLDMKLSPDGKHIAARVRQEGLVSMVVLNTE